MSPKQKAAGGLGSAVDLRAPLDAVKKQTDTMRTELDQAVGTPWPQEFPQSSRFIQNARGKMGQSGAESRSSPLAKGLISGRRAGQLPLFLVREYSADRTAMGECLEKRQSD